MEAVTTERIVVRRFAETDLLDLLAYQMHPETFQCPVSEPMSK